MDFDPSDALGSIGETIEQLQRDVSALQQAPAAPAIESRLSTLEADVASLRARLDAMKIVPLDEAFAAKLGTELTNALVASLDGAAAVEVP